MFCNKCGKEILQEAKFCPSCGNQIEWVAQQAPQYKETSIRKPIQKKPVVIGTIVGLVAIVTFCAVYFGFGNNKWEKAYSDILAKYKISAEKICLNDELDYEIIAGDTVVGQSIDNMGYTIKDINNSGSPELILFSVNSSSDAIRENEILAIYSLQNKMPYEIIRAGYRSPYTIRVDGTIVAESGGSTTWGCTAYKLEKDDVTLTFIEEYGQESSSTDYKNGQFIIKKVQYRDLGKGREYTEDLEITHGYKFINVPSEYIELEFTPISSHGDKKKEKTEGLSGRYSYAGDTSSVAGAIMKLTYFNFSTDGTVIYHQSECDFKGTYKKKGSKYVATFTEVEGPTAMVNNITAVANDKNWKMDIKFNDDGSMTVKADGLLAKSLGLSSETQYKKQ